MAAPSVLNVTSINPPSKDLEMMPLADTDYLIQDLVGNRNHLHTYCQLRNSFINKSDKYGIWESNLPHYFLPSINVFPEIIHLCAANYEPNQRDVKSPSGRILFYIKAHYINQMLNFKQTQQLLPFSMNNLLGKASWLPGLRFEEMVKTFMRADCQPKEPPPLPYDHFNEVGKLLIDMISYVLGITTGDHVDETVLVVLSSFSQGQPPALKYDYASFIANKIHDQLLNLDRQGVFRYSLYTYHLLMYYQSKVFQCPIKKLDSKGERRSIVFWSAVFHQVQYSPYSYCEFIDQSVYPVSCLLMKAPPPRITYEMQKLLQLSKSYKVGDWYLYQDHTMIRVYDCELCPYRLLRYVPMRLFALEYYRKLINSYLTHFHSTKKRAQLKFKNQLGPFVMNKKEGWQDTDLILKDQLKLKRIFWWVPYDPLGFINARRVKYRLTPYDHCKNPHIEKYANQVAWAQGTLVEEFTQEEILEQTPKDLEKTLDLDSADQVNFELPYQIEEGTSTAVSSQAAQGTSTSTTGSAKGKEPMEAEQGMVMQQLVASMEETQVQAPT